MFVFLPPELLGAILVFLPVRDIKNCRFVHSRLAYVGFPYLTQKLFISNFCPKSIQNIAQSPYGSLSQTKELVLYNGVWKGRCLSPELYLRNLLFYLPSLQCIELSHEYIKRYPQTHAKALFPLYTVGNSFTTVLRAIEDSSKARKLIITGVLDTRHIQIEKDLTCITHLSINALQLPDKFALQFLTHFPNLERLSIQSSHHWIKSIRMSHLRWGALKWLKLNSFCVSEDDLLNFIIHNQLLEQLILEDMCVDAGSWTSFCLRLNAISRNIAVLFEGLFSSRPLQLLGPIISGRKLQDLASETPFSVEVRG